MMIPGFDMAAGVKWAVVSALLVAVSGVDGKTVSDPNEAKSSAEIIAESEVIATGRILNTVILTVLDNPGPLPDPVVVIDPEGTPLLVGPETASWYLDELLNPPRLLIYRIDFEMTDVFLGPYVPNDVITVNLVYGVHIDPLTSYWFSYRDPFFVSDPEVSMTLHLKQVEPIEDPPVFELVTKPWLVPGGLAAMSPAMNRSRVRRYQQFVEIEEAVGNLAATGSDGLSALGQLVMDPDLGLGGAVLTSGEQSALHSVVLSEDPQATQIQNWRNWWDSEKGKFIDFPFRVVIAPDGTEAQRADQDNDGDVDGVDFGVFSSCFNGAGKPPRTAGCSPQQAAEVDFDGDNDVDGVDFGVFASCFNGAGRAPRCP